jgi:hypothetical protein
LDSISIIRESVKYFELISAVVGTIYFYKYRHTSLKYFLFLLWYITLTEFLGSISINNEILVVFDKNGVKYNYWMFNLLYFILFNTVYMTYLQFIAHPKQKTFIKFFMVFYIITSIINWTFIQNFLYEMSEIPFVIGSILLIIIIIFYFIQLLKSNKIIAFHKDLLFWISVGLLIFHSGTIPFSIKYNGYALLPKIHNLFLIIYILSICMYILFTFGFIFSNKIENKNS